MAGLLTDVNRVTMAAIYDLFPTVCAWRWYFSRLFTRTAEVHMRTTQTKVVFLISYAKCWLGSNSNDCHAHSALRLQSRLCSLAYEHRWVTNADCKHKLLTGIRLHHRPSWFLRLNRLQTGLLGFVDPVSDSSNRLHETGKSRTGLGLVWQIDCALSNVRAFLNFWTVLKLLQRTVVYSERRLLRSFTEGATWWGQQLANSHCLNTVHKLFVEWSNCFLSGHLLDVECFWPILYEYVHLCGIQLITVHMWVIFSYKASSTSHTTGSVSTPNCLARNE